MEQAHPELELLYEKYIRHVTYEEVEHIPTEFKEFEGSMTVQEGCLLIGYDAFDRHYKECIGILKQEQSSKKQKSMAADVLLCMNGQNEKAWNFKRSLDWKELDLGRELRFNAAICMKFKKSSACYDYRLELVKSEGQLANPEQRMVSEHEFIVRVLKRFHRNVYCGIYRLKLYKYLLGICKDKQNFEQSELLFFKRLCESNIHDYSAFWYRFNLVKESIHGLKESELQWVDQLIYTYETMYS